MEHGASDHYFNQISLGCFTSTCVGSNRFQKTEVYYNITRLLIDMFTYVVNVITSKEDRSLDYKRQQCASNLPKFDGVYHFIRYHNFHIFVQNKIYIVAFSLHFSLKIITVNMS